MARFVRDEKRTFPFAWLTIGGLFAASAVGAFYAELTTRVSWEENQKRFFKLEHNLAKDAQKDAKAAWQVASQKGVLKSTMAKLAKLKKQQQDPGSAYGKAKARVAELDLAYSTAEQNKTFSNSDLDEAYYYRNLQEYKRDAAVVKVWELYKKHYGATDAKRAKSEPAAMFADPSKSPALNGESAAMTHLRNEVARMKAHAAQIGTAAATGHAADLNTALADARSEMLNVKARLEVELKHQARIDQSLAQMRLAKGPAAPRIDEKAPSKIGAARDAARKATCQGKEADTSRCLRWTKLGPLDAEVKSLSIAVAKAKRPLNDADLRLAKAKERAEPSFDPSNPLKYLVGPLQIQQIVTSWIDHERDVDIQQVDRCTTCHMGVNSSNYTDASIPPDFRSHPRRGLLLKAHPVEKFGCTACHQGQGRATNDLAHSAWHLHEKWGKERWHYDGDHYWEDPLLPVGKLEKIIVDKHNDSFGVKLGKSKAATLKLKHGSYKNETELFSELQSKLQKVLAANKKLASSWRATVRKIDNRVQLGIEPLKKKPGKDLVRPKSVKFDFDKIGLAGLLGFNSGAFVSKTATMFTASRPMALPVRSASVAADGLLVNTSKDYKFLPPNGAAGLQLPDDQRNRFIQALPEIESSCLRCHSQDANLVPRRSHDAHVKSKLAFQKAEAEKKKNPTAYAKAHGNTMPRVSEAPQAMDSLAPTLDQGRNLFRRLHCNGCHILDGFKQNRDHAPALDSIGAKVTPEWLVAWLRNPRGWRHKTSMPNLWPAPLEPASKEPYKAGSPEHSKWKEARAEETIAIAAYLVERSTNPTAAMKAQPGGMTPTQKIAGYGNVDGATAEQGKVLFESYGCQGCHANTDGKGLPEAWRKRERDVAPTLTNLALKTNADWLTYWIEDPSRYWHKTSMPNLRVSRAEAASIARYLLTLKSETPMAEKVLADEIKLVADGKMRNAKVPCGAAGGVLMSRVDCGQKLIAKRGCFGCHAVSGYEKVAPIGPELTGFAKKDITTLDYGYAIADHHLQTTETFASLKLDSPRIYTRDRIELKMGDFDLSAREIRALVIFLKGTVPAKPAEKFDPMKQPAYVSAVEGRQLVEDLNCRGCHLIEGKGADINQWASRADRFGGDIKQMGAPFLDGEGARVQPEWLFNFFRNPKKHGIRPWLHPEWAYPNEKVPNKHLALRMPSFKLSPEQWTSIVRYFATWDKQAYPYQVPKVAELNTTEKLWALGNMNSGQTGNCLSCHYYQDFPVERARGDLKKMAPNIAVMQKRLRPDWTLSWFLRPANYLPYTKMLANFASVDRPKGSRWGGENDPYLSPPATGWDATFFAPAGTPEEKLSDLQKWVAGQPAAKQAKLRSLIAGMGSEDQARILRNFIFQMPVDAPWPKPGTAGTSIMVDPKAGSVAEKDAAKKGKEVGAKVGTRAAL